MIRFESSFESYSQCYRCERPIVELDHDAGGLYVPTGIAERERRPHNKPPFTIVHTCHSQVCQPCFDSEPALIEAKLEGRRFFEMHPWKRCACGGVVRNDDEVIFHDRRHCMRCRIRYGAHEKSLRQLRHVDRLIKELRRRCREQDGRHAAQAA